MFMVITVTRTLTPKGRTTDPGEIGSGKATSTIPRGSANFNKLAVQLSLDPLVRSFAFVESLPVSGCCVRVGMLVAERDDGRFAFDIVDERPLRDLDTEGLLLVALRQHGISLVKTDGAQINAEPKAANCRRIWNSRVDVDGSTKASIEAALAERGSLSIRALGSFIGLRDPLQVVCALVRQGTVAIDISARLDANTVVALPSPITLPSKGQRTLGRRPQ